MALIRDPVIPNKLLLVKAAAAYRKFEPVDPVVISDAILRKRSTKLAQYIDTNAEPLLDARGAATPRIKLLHFPLDDDALGVYTGLMDGKLRWEEFEDAYANENLRSLTQAFQLYELAMEYDDIGAADAAVDAVHDKLLDPEFNDDSFSPISDSLKIFDRGSLGRCMLVDVLSAPSLACYLHSDRFGWLRYVDDQEFTKKLLEAVAKRYGTCEVASGAVGCTEEDEDEDEDSAMEGTDGDDACKFHLHVALGKPCYKVSLVP